MEERAAKRFLTLFARKLHAKAKAGYGSVARQLGMVEGSLEAELYSDAVYTWASAEDVRDHAWREEERKWNAQMQKGHW